MPHVRYPVALLASRYETLIERTARIEQAPTLAELPLIEKDGIEEWKCFRDRATGGARITTHFVLLSRTAN